VERRRAGSRAPLFVFFCVTGQGGLLAGARDLTIVEQRNQEDSSDVFPSVAGSRKPPRYPEKETSPAKTLIKTSEEPTIQWIKPPAGIRKAST
jgi:hypothetical protein